MMRTSKAQFRTCSIMLKCFKTFRFRGNIIGLNTLDFPPYFTTLLRPVCFAAQ